MARLFLDKDDNVLVSDRLTVLGSTSAETVRLANTAIASINSNVDTIQFEGNIADYKFAVQGTNLLVTYNGASLATIGIQTDIDGTALKFADTTTTSVLSSLGTATLGKTSLTTTSASYTKDQVLGTVAPTTTAPTDMYKLYSNNYIKQLVTGSDNLFMVGNVSTSYQLNRSSDILVNKLNSDLSIAKSVYVGDVNAQYFEASASISDGGVVITGRQSVSGINGEDSYISKLDANLGVVATVKVGTTGVDDLVNAIATRADGKVVAVGYEYSQADAKDAYILLLNSDMTVAAQKRVDNSAVQNSDEYFSAVYTLKDNSILANAGSGTIAQFDQNLNLVRTVDFSQNIDKFIQVTDGRIFAYTSSYLYQLNSDLSVAHVWQANFSMSDIEVSGNNLMVNINYNEVVQLDISNTQPVVTQAEYVTTRTGGNPYPDDLVLYKDTALLVDYAGIFSLKPSNATQPNLAGDYRVYEDDITKFSLTEKTVSSIISQTPLTYTADNFSSSVTMVGTLNFTTLDATGVTTISGSGSLIG
jgi:hypothetical protein